MGRDVTQIPIFNIATAILKYGFFVILILFCLSLCPYFCCGNQCLYWQISLCNASL